MKGHHLPKSGVVFPRGSQRRCRGPPETINRDDLSTTAQKQAVSQEVSLNDTDFGADAEPVVVQRFVKPNIQKPGISSPTSIVQENVSEDCDHGVVDQATVDSNAALPLTDYREIHSDFAPPLTPSYPNFDLDMQGALMEEQTSIHDGWPNLSHSLLGDKAQPIAESTAQGTNSRGNDSQAEPTASMQSSRTQLSPDLFGIEFESSTDFFQLGNEDLFANLVAPGIHPGMLHAWPDNTIMDMSPNVQIPEWAPRPLGTSDTHLRSHTRQCSSEALTSRGQSQLNILSSNRIEEVQKCWPIDTKMNSMLNMSTWDSILRDGARNLFSMESEADPGHDCDNHVASPWDFDLGCWSRVKDILNSPSPSTSRTPSAESAPLPSNNSEPPEGSAVAMPPFDNFEMILDLFFLQFQYLSIVPIVHTPTFSAKACPTTLLLSIVTLGCSMIRTTAANLFVSQIFPGVVDILQAELKSRAKVAGFSREVIVSLASALLILYAALISGERGKIQEARTLYIDTLSLAQWYGVFTISESVFCGPTLDDGIKLEQIWTTWSKAESLKRIQGAFIELDSWYSGYFSTMPILRPEALRIAAPAQNDLFQADSAQRWGQLFKGQQPLSTVLATPFTFPRSLDLTKSASLYAYLNILYHRTTEIYCRLITSPEMAREIEPWRSYEKDFRDRSLRPLLTAIPRERAGGLRSTDLNSSLLWNFTSMLLCVNVRMLEHSSGRYGGKLAAQGLEDIRVWAQTPSARRAVLHAGQIYRLLYDRRASDPLGPHAMSAAFTAGLAMGFYYEFATATTPVHPTTLADLFSELDWGSIADCGLANGPEALDSMPQPDGSESLRQFIRSGGQFTVRGRVLPWKCSTGRKSMIHFADLLENIWRKKASPYSCVLHAVAETTSYTMP